MIKNIFEIFDFVVEDVSLFNYFNFRVCIGKFVTVGKTEKMLHMIYIFLIGIKFQAG